MLTVQCEGFPSGPAEDRPDPWRRGDEGWVETEARLFGAAVRTAYRRLADGLTRAARATPGPAKVVQTAAERASSLRLELKRHLQTAFGLSSADPAPR
jgi:hypothetical protein